MGRTEKIDKGSTSGSEKMEIDTEIGAAARAVGTTSSNTEITSKNDVDRISTTAR